MAEISEYEKLCLKNIEENRRILMELGLLSKDWKPSTIQLHLNPAVKKKVIKPKKSIENNPALYLACRKTRRSTGSNDVDDTDSVNSSEWGESDKEKPPKKPNVYGAIEGVEVGDWWDTRIECSNAGVHRPTVAGIHPGPDGAYSIAMSGGYEDNYDSGISFTYTGAGGRDLKGTKANPKNLRTGPQVKDQVLDGANGSLAHSVVTKNPIRVIRGYKSNSIFAPDTGYRYDGLYQVEKYWTTVGASGFLVYKFALKRCLNQGPPPWTIVNNGMSEINKILSPDQKETVLSSLVSKVPYVLLENNVELMNNIGSTPSKHLVNDHENDSGNNRFVNSNDNGSNKVQSKVNGIKSLSFNSDVNEDKTLHKTKSPAKKFCKNDNSRLSSSPNKDGSSFKCNNLNNNVVTGEYLNGVQSPVKMVASNQPYDESSTLKLKVDDNSSNGDDFKSHRPQKISRRKRSDSKENDKKSNVTVNNNNNSSNLVIRNIISSDIFDEDCPSYLKSRRKATETHDIKNSTGDKTVNTKKRPRSPSPDDFAKICDELCNDLPKIEKLNRSNKRIRFSLDNISDKDLKINIFKSKKKRMSGRIHTPRKSSLVSKVDIKSQEIKINNSNTIFAKHLSTLSKLILDNNEEKDKFGWDIIEYMKDAFKGWTDIEVIESKKLSSTFADVIFNCSDNDDNGWPGWEADVSKRSLVLNGFLLADISKSHQENNFHISNDVLTNQVELDSDDSSNEFYGFHS